MNGEQASSELSTQKPRQGLLSRKQARTLVEYLSALLLGFVLLFPVLWLFKSSFQPLKDLLATPPIWIPESLYLKNYIEVIKDKSVLLALRNSLIISGMSTLIATAVGVVAAYAFVRFRFRGRNTLFLGILLTQMLPGIAIVIPLYILMRQLGVLHTYGGLIVAYVSFTLPYAIWLQRAYLTGAFWELEDQARVDGCTRLGAFFRVVLPTIMPGVITAAIFAFVNTWNEYLFALVLTDPHTKTFPVRLSEYINQERIALELMFPAGIIATIPALLLIAFFGRYMVQGLTAGSVKGS